MPANKNKPNRKKVMETQQTALGMIETRSYAAAVEAADAMVKAARVSIAGFISTGGGFITVVVRGDVASVKAAVETASQAAERVGTLIAAHVIPRLHEEVESALASGKMAISGNQD